MPVAGVPLNLSDNFTLDLGGRIAGIYLRKNLLLRRVTLLEPVGVGN